MTQTVQRLSLGQYEWKWRETGTEDAWTKCSRFPTVIHHELKVMGKIPDEGVGFNERKIQWVGEKDWIFSCSFPTPKDILSYPKAELVFDGLDTIATVKLNNKIILETDNVFVPERVDVKDLLLQNGENNIEILFESAARLGLEREEKHGITYKNIRESSRVYVRKAQYQWGWDWGPAMITCGPYKDIRLETSTSKLIDLYAKVSLSSDLRTAQVELYAEMDSKGNVEVEFFVFGPGVENLTASSAASGTLITSNFHVADPQLWWPVGHGSQPLYKAEVRLVSGNILDSRSTHFGIRKVELVQEPLSSGKSFFFRMNNKPIFAVGTNWVPCSSIPPIVTPQFYQKWLDMALENNNNMIRVWGGGYYEDDAFYDYCDEKGIMLWHDCMFACGLYPTDDAFQKSVSREIEAQVKRLRNHVSIMLWNGDNEYFMMLDRQDIPYDPQQTDNFDVFPERVLYFKTIADVIKRLDLVVPYWPSSPWGGNVANGPEEGDLHQWDVWHGLQKHYQEYPKMGGKFVSEYGMHGFPDMRTVKYFAPDPKTRYPNSKVMDCHNKSTGADTKLGKYLSGNFRINWYNMADYVYLSQLMQCEALTYANRAWRRGWKGPGKEECSGVLIWQLNDIYPVTSWALVDSFFRRKPAFFTTKRDFATVCIGISRTPVWHFVDENKRREHVTDIPTYEIFASNFGGEIPTELRLRMYDWTTHREIDIGSDASTKHILGANRSTELMVLNSPPAITEDSYVILAATLHDEHTGEELSRHFSWPEPYRYLTAAYDASVDTVVKADSVEITCGRYPVKGLLAYIDSEDGEEADWKDNMYDLMPGEKMVLAVNGIDGRKVKTRWLYSWENEKSFS